MRLDDIIENVVDALTGRDDQAGRERQRDVLPSSQDPWGDPADQPHSRDAGYGDAAPASQDPFGDPADQGYGRTARYPNNVASASEDPFGDPADEMAGEEPLPASRDPYGDPADRR
jgi:hypothetical protein